jgi:transcriptional/translational regulatory protein YebC/TACO1
MSHPANDTFFENKASYLIEKVSQGREIIFEAIREANIEDIHYNQGMENLLYKEYPELASLFDHLMKITVK